MVVSCGILARFLMQRQAVALLNVKHLSCFFAGQLVSFLGFWKNSSIVLHCFFPSTFLYPKMQSGRL